MKNKNIATFYAILAAALYAINVSLSKILLQHASPNMRLLFLYPGEQKTRKNSELKNSLFFYLKSWGATWESISFLSYAEYSALNSPSTYLPSVWGSRRTLSLGKS